MQSFDEMVKEIYRNYDNDVKMVQEKSRQNQIVIFGAGQLGHRVQRILNERGVQIKCFCDNHVSEQVDVQTGLEIVRIDELQTGIETFFILTAVFEDIDHHAVYQQLLDFGFEKNQIMNAKNIAERLPLSYLEQNMEKYESVYSLLKDDYSKEVYLERIKKVYLDQDISHVVSKPEEEYFDKKLIMSEEEVFIDCGGFDGDTAVRFLEKTKGKYKKIIIFEPEESKKNLIKKNLGDHDFELYCCGVWSCDTILKFNARGDSASSIYEDGDVEVPVKALDDTVYQYAPTFIKMDIEGSEVEALKGSKEIIKKYKPKLAICIYHKPEDLYTIPLMIKELHKDYRLFIRQYANSKYETVCYAV